MVTVGLTRMFAAAVLALGLTCGSEAQQAQVSLGNNEALYVDGRTFQIISGAPKGGTPDPIQSLNARYLGPAAIVFRANDKLYVASVPLPLEGGGAGEDAYVTAAQYGPPTDPAQSTT